MNLPFHIYDMWNGRFLLPPVLPFVVSQTDRCPDVVINICDEVEKGSFKNVEGRLASVYYFATGSCIKILDPCTQSIAVYPVVVVYAPQV